MRKKWVLLQVLAVLNAVFQYGTRPAEQDEGRQSDRILSSIFHPYLIARIPLAGSSINHWLVITGGISRAHIRAHPRHDLRYQKMSLRMALSQLIGILHTCGNRTARAVWCYCSDMVSLYQLISKSVLFYGLTECSGLVNEMLLMLSGDVESNPGPTTQLNPGDLGGLKMLHQVVAVCVYGRHMSAYLIHHLLACLCELLFSLSLDYTAVATSDTRLKKQINTANRMTYWRSSPRPSTHHCRLGVRCVFPGPGLGVYSGLWRMVMDIILLLLILSGDIEINPGPFGQLHEEDLHVVVEELSPLHTSWEKLIQVLAVSGDSLHDALHKWLLLSDIRHWHEVVDALRSVGEECLASELKVKYGLLEETDLDVVADELDGVSTKWYTLGQHLGLRDLQLDRIRTRYSDKACLREMLYNSISVSTWSDIIAVLRSSSDAQLADHLDTKYCSSLLRESHLDMIVNELSIMSAKWESLGQQLGIPRQSLGSIRGQYSHIADRLSNVMKKWLQQSHRGISKGLLTWSHVVLALKSPNVGESQLGEYLKEKYLPAAVSGAQKILEEALEKGYVDCHIWKVLVLGAVGCGKTSLKHRLFGEEPPSIRCSTALAEAAIRAISRVIVGTDLTGWFRVTYDQLMEMLGGVLKAGVPMEKTKASFLPEDVVHGQSPKVDASKPPKPPKQTGDPGLSSTASPSSLTTSALTPTAPAATPVSSSKQELVRLVEKSKGSKRFLELQWIHFIDTGGQPQFHEVLPAFIRNTTATVFVMKLSERLDEHPTIEYYDGNSQPSRYALRNDQMLQHCIRTVLSRPSTREGKHSKVFLVGTHRDLEVSSSESRAEKNSKLIDMLKPSLQDHLVYYRPFSEVIFPVNAKDPVEHDDKIFAMIRRLIEDKTHAPPPYKVPIGWFLLEQDITKSAKGGVISRKECMAIAAVLNIREEALSAALTYFNDLSIFLYYPSVLPDVVFCSPQVLPDKVTEFVHFSYILHSDSSPVAVQGKWLQFRDKGIVTVDMFQDKMFSAHYIPDLFTPADLIKLFQHLLIVAPLSATEYLMPSLLQMLTPEEVRKQLPPPSASVAPLLVHFSAGCAQNGVFCALVVYLLSECHWKIACGPEGTPHCFSRSCICFQLPDTPVCVTLVDSFAFFEVHVHAPQTTYPKVCPMIREAIFSGLDAAAKVLRYSNSKPRPAFFCQCGSLPHVATPSRSFDGEECYLMCTKTINYFPLTKQHAIWLDVQLLPTISVDLDERPNLLQLVCFPGKSGNINIPRQIGTKYFAFGVVLLSDETGAELSALTTKYQGDAEQINLKILRLWIGGKGKPLSWDVLIDVLKAIGVSSLASDIRDISDGHLDERPNLAIPKDLDERPNLLQLVCFPGKSGNINIPRQIGTKYFAFGVVLLSDETGAELSALTTKYQDDAEQINLEILRLWIGGKGKPLGWDVLIDVLKAIGVSSLAYDIRDIRDERMDDPSLSTNQSLPSPSQTSEQLSQAAARDRLLIQRHIKQQGSLKMNSHKVLLCGLPRTGKTTAMLRLSNQLRCLDPEDFPNPSTGFEKPRTVELQSVMIAGEGEKVEWKYEDLKQQILTLCSHILKPPSNSTSSPTMTSSSQSDVTTVSEKAEAEYSYHLEQQGDSLYSHTLKSSSSNTSSPAITSSSQSDVSSSRVAEDTSKDVLPSKLDELQVVLTSLVKAQNWKAVREKLKAIEDMSILHIMDCGGHPECHEILPLLLEGRALSLVFLNLTHDLGKTYPVVFQGEKGHSSIAQESDFTVRVVLERILSSISSLQFGARERPVALLVGTYLGETDQEAVLTLDQSVQEGLKSFIKNDTLFPANVNEGKYIATLDNMSDDQGDIEELRRVILTIIETRFEPERIPTAWLMLHLLLRAKYEQEPGWCTVEECVEVATACGIESEELRKKDGILCYIHKNYGTLLYYPNITGLCEKVICDPNIILNTFTQIFRCSYACIEGYYNTTVSIQATGEIPIDMMERICAKKSDDHIPTTEIVALLKDRYILYEDIRNTKDTRNYFMPCLLQPDPSVAKEASNPTTLSSLNPAPLLLVPHSTGYVPLGLFPALVVKMSHTWYLTKGERFRNRIQFKVRQEGKPARRVEFRQHASYLELRLLHKDFTVLTTCRQQLWEALHEVSSEYPHMKEDGWKFGFYCPGCLQPGGQPHSAVCMTKGSAPVDMECSHDPCCEKEDFLLESKHMSWFKDQGCDSDPPPATEATTSGAATQSSPNVCSPSGSQVITDTPIMAQLMVLKSAKGDKVEIIQTIAPDWKNVGILMNFDPIARKVECIEADHAHKRHGSVICCQEMFKLWLKRPDATWGNLIELLIDSGFSTLADQVKNALG